MPSLWTPIAAPTLADHAIAVLLALVLPLLAVRGRSLGGDEYTTSEKIALYWSNSAAMWVAAGLVVLAWRWAGRSLAELGLGAGRAPGFTWGVGLAVVALLAYALDLWSKLRPARIERTRREWRERTAFMPTSRREIGHSLVLVVSAGVCEEVLYRGFLVAYAAWLFGSSPAGLTAAVVVPALVFGVAHVYQGTRAVLTIVGGGALFGGVLVTTGTLWIAIALHAGIDLVGSLLGPVLLADKGE